MVDDIDDIRRGDRMRRKGQKERRVNELENRLWVDGIGGKLLGLLRVISIRSDPRPVTSPQGRGTGW